MATKYFRGVQTRGPTVGLKPRASCFPREHFAIFASEPHGRPLTFACCFRIRRQTVEVVTGHLLCFMFIMLSVEPCLMVRGKWH